MFSFFGNKKEKTRVIDKVFLSTTARQTAIADFLRGHPETIIVCWFDESYDEVARMLASQSLNAEIHLAKEISSHHISGRTVIFYEHYPLLEKEQELIEKLQLKESIVYSSLDQPLFLHFGGDRISGLARQLGLSENEAIQHSMITNSIQNAQKKLSDSVITEQAARSQSDWFARNFPLKD